MLAKNFLYCNIIYMLKVRSVLKIEQDVLGPGERVGVWFQGCTIRCSGCMVPESWDPSGGKSYTPFELFGEIKGFGIKEVTLSGGEPFDQDGESFLQLLTLLKEEDYGIVCYSGYQLEELLQRGFEEHLKKIDLLIDGRYIPELDDNLPWRGSSNQRLILLSERYRDLVFPQSRKVQIIVLEGKYMIVGIADRELISTFRSSLSESD